MKLLVILSNCMLQTIVPFSLNFSSLQCFILACNHIYENFEENREIINHLQRWQYKICYPLCQLATIIALTRDTCMYISNMTAT